MLCAGFFIMFVASTILIHGLVTGLPWGLASWSIIIGILSIPELVFVMIMTTQYWVSGAQTRKMLKIGGVKINEFHNFYFQIHW